MYFMDIFLIVLRKHELARIQSVFEGHKIHHLYLFSHKEVEQQLLIRKAIITRRGLNRLYLILSGLLILFTSGGRLISRESILFPTVITRTR
jgi:hypothetical protein